MFRHALAALALIVAAPALADVDRWSLEGWKTDFSKVEVDPSEIVSVIFRDQIPAINDPLSVAVARETELPDAEPVISLEVNGEARAYPLRIMMWHEIANDVLGGKPVAVTYCPLCNAAIVFDATVDGEVYDFGTTGKLRNSDLVMYDRQTETWWQQFSGKGLIGRHAGEQLPMIPSRLDSWGNFKAEYPNGTVLVPRDTNIRQYGRNPYDGYDSSLSPFLFRGALPENLPALQRVVYVRGDNPIAIAWPVLQEKGEVREGDVVIRWEPGQASALDTRRISDGKDVGSVTVTDAASGEDLVHDVTFAFVVNAFEPSVVIRTE